MAKPPKSLDDVDWETASRHLIEAFPGASLAEVVARAEMAAVTLDHVGKPREAESMRRAARHIRKKVMN
ncbi:hypothetical protein [Caulobacter sp. X]|uniref:hypothetical protein n=1 Tax=Caulobacter sp. X TaxID=2048901 RepID=UPI000C158A7C|nr:hypothetical protein [Caulobacter sp. X]PIB96959.1 hypothetical protein CSW60_20990 [Caulobacter sp. X]